MSSQIFTTKKMKQEKVVQKKKWIWGLVLSVLTLGGAAGIWTWVGSGDRSSSHASSTSQASNDNSGQMLPKFASKSDTNSSQGSEEQKRIRQLAREARSKNLTSLNESKKQKAIAKIKGKKSKLSASKSKKSKKHKLSKAKHKSKSKMLAHKSKHKKQKASKKVSKRKSQGKHLASKN